MYIDDHSFTAFIAAVKGRHRKTGASSLNFWSRSVGNCTEQSRGFRTLVKLQWSSSPNRLYHIRTAVTHYRTYGRRHCNLIAAVLAIRDVLHLGSLLLSLVIFRAYGGGARH